MYLGPDYKAQHLRSRGHHVLEMYLLVLLSFGVGVGEEAPHAPHEVFGQALVYVPYAFPQVEGGIAVDSPEEVIGKGFPERTPYLPVGESEGVFKRVPVIILDGKVARLEKERYHGVSRIRYVVELRFLPPLPLQGVETVGVGFYETYQKGRRPGVKPEVLKLVLIECIDDALGIVHSFPSRCEAVAVIHLPEFIPGLPFRDVMFLRERGDGGREITVKL